MGTAQVTESPDVAADHVVFRLPDPDDALAGVDLLQEVRRPRHGPPLQRSADGTWELRFERPDADRMEYLFHLVHHDGGTETIPDPANPRRAPGPFGDKSVVEWPGYSPPAWLDRAPAPGTVRETMVKTRRPRRELHLAVWEPEGTEQGAPLPLLIAHDGPEYDRYSGLTHLISVAIADGRIPGCRVALLAPADRDLMYSASSAYSRAFAYDLLPAILEAAPTPHGRSMRVGMGASLGALAMLHVHRTSPATFGGLYLQSGSFFRQRFDKQESGFVRFRRIARFVGTVLTVQDWAHPIPVAMACGTIEENLRNNLAVRDALTRQGYEVDFTTFRDGHTWVGWRDAFDPALIDLLGRLWA